MRYLSILTLVLIFAATLSFASLTFTGMAAGPVSEEDLYFEAITLEESASGVEQFRTAVDAYAELLQRFPSSTNAELHGAALFSMGEIYSVHLGDPGRGKWAFSEIKRRFPDSSWDARATEELNRLGRVSEAPPPGLGSSSGGGGRDGLGPGGFDASSLGLGPAGGGQSRPPSASWTTGAARPSPGMAEAAAGLGGVAGSAGTTGTDSSGSAKYANSFTGFTLNFPRGSVMGTAEDEVLTGTWVVSEEAADAIEGMEVFAYKVANSMADPTESPATINVIVKFMDTEVNVIELSSAAGQALNSMEGVEQVEEKAVNLSGDLCVISKYESHNAGKDLIQVQAYFARDRRAFIVTASIDPTAASGLEEEVMGIVKTFKTTEFTR